MSDSKLPDVTYVRELAKVFKQYGLDEVEIETGDEDDAVEVPLAKSLKFKDPANQDSSTTSKDGTNCREPAGSLWQCTSDNITVPDENSVLNQLIQIETCKRVLILQQLQQENALLQIFVQN